nr:hypothetical protein [Candidatus Levybacteria bacterium]
MGSKKEKHPHRAILQGMADDLEAQFNLGVKMADDITQESGQTGQLDVNKLLVANRRLERAQVDSAWLNILLRRNIKAKVILEIWSEKDEYCRKMEGMND